MEVLRIHDINDVIAANTGGEGESECMRQPGGEDQTARRCESSRRGKNSLSGSFSDVKSPGFICIARQIVLVFTLFVDGDSNTSIETHIGRILNIGYKDPDSSGRTPPIEIFSKFDGEIGRSWRVGHIVAKLQETYQPAI